MRISTIAAISFAALIGGTSLSVAQTAGAPQVPNPADPAPANPTATNGAPTEAPAKAGNKTGTGDPAATGGDQTSSGKTTPKKKKSKKGHSHGKMAGHRTF